MNWTNKMKEGMKIMKEACREAGFCSDCPFSKYCDILTSSDDFYNEWIFGNNEDN